MATLVIRPRADWQLANEPVTGPSYPKKTIVDVVYHYPGAPAGTSYADPIRKLRQMQHSYLTDPNRGYSLGYNYCVDPYGVAWEVRGVDIRCAATAGYNDRGVAVQFMVGGANPANDLQITAAVELHKWLEQHHGRPLGVTGHRFRGTTATTCPGNGIVSQLPEIERRVRQTVPPPVPPPSPPQEDEDMAYTFVAVSPTGSSALVSHDGAGITFTYLDDRAPYVAAGRDELKVTPGEFDRLAQYVPPIKVVNGTVDDPFDVKLV